MYSQHITSEAYRSCKVERRHICHWAHKQETLNQQELSMIEMLLWGHSNFFLWKNNMRISYYRYCKVYLIYHPVSKYTRSRLLYFFSDRLQQSDFILWLALAVKIKSYSFYYFSITAIFPFFFWYMLWIQFWWKALTYKVLTYKVKPKDL